MNYIHFDNLWRLLKKIKLDFIFNRDSFNLLLLQNTIKTRCLIDHEINEVIQISVSSVSTNLVSNLRHIAEPLPIRYSVCRPLLTKKDFTKSLQLNKILHL